MIDLNSFRKWYEESPENRSVTISMEKNVYFRLKDGVYGYENIKVYVYDRDLSMGQYADNVEDINLPAEKERREREKYEELKAKFNGANE